MNRYIRDHYGSPPLKPALIEINGSLSDGADFLAVETALTDLMASWPGNFLLYPGLIDPYLIVCSDLTGINRLLIDFCLSEACQYREQPCLSFAGYEV